MSNYNPKDRVIMNAPGFPGIHGYKATLIGLIGGRVWEVQIDGDTRTFAYGEELFNPLPAQIVTKIIYWWDATSRNWIVQAMDADDNQIGEAGFAANSRTLPGQLDFFKQQYQTVPVIKIGRNHHYTRPAIIGKQNGI